MRCEYFPDALYALQWSQMLHSLFYSLLTSAQACHKLCIYLACFFQPVSDVKITAKPGQPIENKTFSLTCDASGQVDSIHWVKNDQPLSPSGHITLSADSKTLSFNPVLRSDNDGYKCTASNPASKMSSEVNILTVNYGPEQVSISGSSDNVTVGAELKLTCSAVSQPTAIFTWYLKGKLIHKEAVYLIKSVKLNHAGNYTCEAFNSVTEEKRSYYQVMGTEAPKYFRAEENSNPVSIPKIQFNDTVTLTCMAFGSDVSYQWFNGSSEVLDTERILLSVDRKTLMISGVVRSDDGPFYCYVYNNVSNSTSKPFSLHMQCEFYQHLFQHPSSQFKLFLFVFTSLTVYFSIRGVIQEQAILNLSFKSNYKCQRNNRLHVSVPTIQSNVPNPVEFNDTVALTCTASGSDVSFRWFNGSSEVLDTPRIHLSADKRTLTISGVLRSDDGPFYCYVYNHFSNNISKPFSLDIKYGPDFPTLSVSLYKQVYAAGSSLILQCSAQSYPTAQIQWFLNGTSLYKRSQELEIRKVQVDQAGNYTCWAFNDVTHRYAAVHTVIDVRGGLMDSYAPYNPGVRHGHVTGRNDVLPG
uniref:Ig-like domain-containing protein n=1 Tax=Erpetoichthys calabaricus TaxID=27687 RepID=A0A8C4XI56_ERPCA